MTTPRFVLGSFSALLVAAALSACGGGGSGALPIGSTHAPAGTLATTVQLVIPSRASASATRRKPQFVSAATMSATITVSGSGTTVIDLSPSSNACVAGGDNRICTTSVQAQPGLQTFTITTYDTAPVAGAIPANAHILGLGSATQTISGTSGAVSIELDAVVDGFGSLPSQSSLPADGATHVDGFAIDPVDFDDDPITNTSADPYANPISVTLTETGGSGHAQLMIGGTPSGTSATLTNATQTLSAQYDGGGSPGYSFVVTLSAGGLPPMSTTIAPLYITSTSPLFSNFSVTLGGPATSLPIVAQESAPTPVGYEALPTNCNYIFSFGSTVYSGDGATFTLTGGTGSTAGCVLAFTDGTSTVNINVANTPPTPSPTPGPPYIYVNNGGENGPIETFALSELSPAPATNNIAPVTQLTTQDNTELESSLVLDSLHNVVWMTTQTINVVGYPLGTIGTTASNVAATYSLTPGQIPVLAAVDSAGNVYIEAGGYPHVYLYIYPYGSTSYGTVMDLSPLILATGLTVDASGNIYLSAYNSSDAAGIAVYAPPGLAAGIIYPSPIRTITGFAGTGPIALDSNNDLYAIDNNGTAAVVKIFASGASGAATPLETISGTSAIPFTITSPFTAPDALTLDTNNNLYVSDATHIQIFNASAITGALGGTLTTASASISGNNTNLGNAGGIFVH